MKIGTESKLISEKFLTNMPDSEVEMYGNSESCKWRLRGPNLREDLYVAANKCGEITSISHLKKISGPEAKNCKSWSTHIELKPKKEPTTISELVYTSRSQQRHTLITLSGYYRAIKAEDSTTITASNDNPHGIIQGGFGSSVTFNAFCKQKPFLASKSIIEHKNKKGEDETEKYEYIRYLAVPEDSEIQQLINELRGFQHTFVRKDNNSQAIFALVGIKNACEQFNEKYCEFLDSTRAHFEDEIENLIRARKL